MSKLSNAASGSAKRVIGTGWDVQSIEHPMTAPWGLRIADSDFRSLIQGFQPEVMEDRWMCCTDGPDQQGSILVHIYRSWTGREQFQLKAKTPIDNEKEVGGTERRGAEITDIIWDQGEVPNEVGEEEAKSLATMVCRHILGCKLEAAP